MPNKNTNQNQGTMSVNEAGRRGGEKTSQTHGREFYEEIGHKGGQRVRQLVEEGKQSEGSKSSSTSSARSTRRDND